METSLGEVAWSHEGVLTMRLSTSRFRSFVPAPCFLLTMTGVMMLCIKQTKTLLVAPEVC